MTLDDMLAEVVALATEARGDDDLPEHVREQMEEVRIRAVIAQHEIEIGRHGWHT